MAMASESRFPVFGTTSLLLPQRDTVTNVLAASEQVHTVEITFDYSFNVPIEDRLIEDLVWVKDERNLDYTVHLPLTIALASLNPKLRRASLETLTEVIERSRPIEPSVYVLHVSPVYSPYTSPMGEEFSLKQLEDVKAVLEEGLIELLKLVDSPRKICVENVFASLDLVYDVVERLDLGVCVDVGHLLLDGRDPAAYIREKAGRLEHIHLHDVVERHDHLPLGDPSGLLDVRSLFETLEDIGFGKTIVIEVFKPEHVAKSLATLREAGFWA